jgi:pimeloyl-ACP methyl ester carboxylesterase
MNAETLNIPFREQSLACRIAGAGPPVLLLHAFPFSSAMWESLTAALAGEFTVVAPDFPGFGGSPPVRTTDASMALYAQAAEACATFVVNRDARIHPAASWAACGLSMGGYVLFELIRRRVLPLSSVVLADTRAAADSAEQRAARVALMETVRHGGVAPVAAAQLARMLTPAAPSGMRARVERWMLDAPTAGVLGALHALKERNDSTKTLAEIGCPALVVAGSRDPISPPAEMRAMADAMPASRWLELEGACHLSNVERADEFNAAVLAFLRDTHRANLTRPGTL